MAGMVKGFRGMIMPTSFSVPSSMEVKIGQPQYISYSLLPLNSTNQKIRWSSANTNIATVDSDGMISGVAIGSTTITGVVDADGTSQTLSLTVSAIPVTGISLNETEAYLSVGETIQLEATVTPDDASNKNVNWTSSNTSIATVDSTGLVTVISEGEVTITATTVDGGYTATCNVMPGIPSIYQEVDFIESSGTQYINTGYTPNVNTEIDTIISWGSSQVEWAVFWGVTSADKSSDGILGRIYYSSSTGATNNFNAWFCNATYGEAQKTVTYDSFHTISSKKNSLVVDGSSVTITTSGTPYQSPIFLFCGNNGGSAWRYGKCKIQYFKISESGVVKREFIPCFRKEDGVAGLWDKVNRQFYTNAGSGTFKVGNRINARAAEYKKIEYVQSTGTQYIETFYLDNLNSKIEIDMQFTSLTTQQRLFGHGMDSDYGGVSFESYINGSTQWARATKDGAGNRQSSNVSADTNRHTFVLDNSYYKIYTNGNLIHNGANTATMTRDNTETMTFLARKLKTSATSSTIQQYASAKTYGAKIYENDVVLYNMYPAKCRYDGALGLYDSVNKNFYINMGSGTFIAGPDMGVILNKNSISLSEVGQTEQLTPTTNPASIAEGGFTWSSSNESIATVSSTGLVTCVTPGDCTITCTANSTGDTDTCNVSPFNPIDTCFGYTGTEQSILLEPHTYCLEVWGAQGGQGLRGGSSVICGGKGGYSGGCITLNAATCMYIYVGGLGCCRCSGSGGWACGGYNGGGPILTCGSGGAGGGGTDIRIGGNTLCHRRIVAGGGGGSGWCVAGGAGGGTNGVTVKGGGGTQTSGGAAGGDTACAKSAGVFGTGGCGGGFSEGGGGGGGGWYGGGGNGWCGGGGGGSGYVYNSSTSSSTPSGYYHCSDYYLINAYTCCGAVNFPSPNGSTETGHSGCGCVRIRSID